MTIQEAIKTGGLFRRKKWKYPGYSVKVLETCFYEMIDGQYTGHAYHPSNEDILADDWEVKA